MKKAIDNSLIEMTARWLIGIVFIYASIHKIAAPGDFAKIIYGYGLFPVKAINIMAITLPFIELISGLCLVLGIWPRSSAIIINVLLLSFIIAISINLARGHQFDCGCFSFKAKNLQESASQLLIRDFVLMCGALVPVFFKGKRTLSLLE